MHKISATKIVTLVYNLNIVDTLVAQKDIQEIRQFKTIIVFRVNSKSNKKILKMSNF
jgi:hypothetical protein